MFCIAAFIVFAILGIFSASYRSLAKKAWVCVAKKLTFKPCDINFNEEMKSKLLGKLIFTHPRLAKFLDKWINVLSFIFVVLSIWSLLIVMNSALNLFVYDTCNPNNAESCSLGGEACGIVRGRLTFTEAVMEMQVGNWAGTGLKDLGKTVSLIPDRLKEWNAEDYVTEKSTYYEPFDSQKPTALEIIDPECVFCAKLFQNIKTAEFEKKYNLTYIAYPIPHPDSENGYQFPSSYMITTYLEALKQIQPTTAKLSRPADWLLLEKIFLETNPEGIGWQNELNGSKITPEETKAILASILKELGYSDADVSKVDELARSSEVKDQISRNMEVVEEEIRTIKIPTIMFDGRRHDRVLSAEKLK